MGMSEKTRKKKEGENRDNETARMKEGTPDTRQNQDRPNVHNEKRGPDEYEQDLKRANHGKDPRDRRGVEG
jgi:hypothetical protein